jgi:iron complex outermembrane recepter protein
MLNSKLLCGASITSLVTALGSGAAGAQVPAATPQSQASNVEEVVVTGSRLSQAGFTTPTPVTVLGAEQLETRGFTTATEALNELPAFRNTTGTTRGTAGSFGVGQGLVDLRGLNPNRSLVLVDGRRHVPNNVVGTVAGTWDTNVLPTGLVERIDVVTGGASAAYGSDAVAGVVNFVLNDSLEGFKANLQYGVAEEGDADRYQANTAFGTSFAGDRGHVVLGLDYSKGDPSGTIYSRDWGKDLTFAYGLPANRPAGQPAIFVGQDVRTSVPPGSLVVSCVQGTTTLAGAACPFGNRTFDNAGQPVPFQFGTNRGGIQMVGGGNGDYAFNRNQLLQVEFDRYATLGRVSYDFTDNLSGWVELSGGRFRVESHTLDYYNAGGIIIQRDNPFIPAAIASQMDAGGITRFNLARLNYDQRNGLSPGNENSFTQGAVGLEGEIFEDWNWDGYFSSGKSKFYYKPRYLTVLPNYFAALYVVRDANGNPTCGPIASNPMFNALAPAQRSAFAALVSPGCVPFNPFGPRAESDAAIEYVAPRDTQSLTEWEQQAAALNLAGSPFNTWAGQASLAVGIEWRDDKVATTLDAEDTARSLASAFFAANPQPGSGAQSVKEGYLEIGLPVLDGLPAAASVDLNAAVRYTDYSVAGEVTTWKGGVTWDVIEGVRLRATRSRDIRAPNIPELFYRGNDGFIVATNPITGGTNQINSAALNNPDLEPEEADTWTVGLVLQPTWAQGLSMSIDYYSIEIKGTIGTIPAANIIRGYYLEGRQDYAQYFTFDSSAPAGFTRVDSPQLNLNRQETSGVDFNLDYRLPVDAFGVPGQFAVNLAASYLNNLETFDPTGASLGDMARVIPKYRATANFNYQLGRFGTTLTTRYTSSFHYGVFFVGPDEPNYNPALPNSINDNLFPSAAYFSLQGEFALRDQSNGRVVVFAIVDNLFDKDPGGSPQLLDALGVPSGAGGGVNPFDPIGRYYKAGVRATF